MTEIPNAHITRYGISFDGQEVPGMIIQGGPTLIEADSE